MQPRRKQIIQFDHQIQDEAANATQQQGSKAVTMHTGERPGRSQFTAMDLTPPTEQAK